MKRLLLIVLIVCGRASAVCAQEEPKFEIFGGFSHVQVDRNAFESFGFVTVLGTPVVSQRDFPKDYIGANGFHVAATGYIWKGLGVTGDISGHSQSESNSSTFQPQCLTTPCLPISFSSKRRSRLYNFLGGPQYKRHLGGRTSVFGHALFGVAETHFNSEISQTSSNGPAFTSKFQENNGAFAMAFGGGFDVDVSKRVAVRVIQFDYNPIFREVVTGFQDNPGGIYHVNAFRFSFGVVFK